MFTSDKRSSLDRGEKERLILLGTTGELGRRERRTLERLLAEDEDTRRLAEEIEGIFTLGKTEEGVTPKSDTIEAIKRAGRRELARESRARPSPIDTPFMNLWRPAAISAVAALFMLAVVIPLWWNESDQREDRAVDFASMEWNRRFEEQLDELDEEVTLAVLEYAEVADSDRDIDELAREYIEMEETEI